MSTSTSVSPTPISSAAAEPAAGVFPACVNFLGRLVLAGFTLVASVLFHAYWAAPADQAFMQQLMFFKNLGVIGGLLVLAAAAPGSWSLDGRR